LDTAAEYFKKMSSSRLFETRNIIEFKDGRYIVSNPITTDRRRRMKKAMTEKDARDFEAYCEKHLNAGEVITA